MRIISGIYKNRRINFRNLRVRPTTDFAKESLFNILNNNFDLNTVHILDLFAGCGNISYEFLSRGAQNVTSIESNIKCVNFMKKIKSELHMEKLTIKCSTVNKYLKNNREKYDIIFSDPPYNYTQNQYNLMLNTIFKNKLLNESGVLVMEHSKLINFDNSVFFVDKKKYGRVHFTFLKYEKY